MSYRKDRLISAEEIEIQPVTGLLVSGMVLLAPMLPASGKPPPPTLAQSSVSTWVILPQSLKSLAPSSLSPSLPLLLSNWMILLNSLLPLCTYRNTPTNPEGPISLCSQLTIIPTLPQLLLIQLESQSQSS